MSGIVEGIGAAVGFVVGAMLQGGLMALGAYVALTWIGVL